MNPLQRAANFREKQHLHNPSSRQLTNNTNEVGLCGEFAFAELCGYYPDLSAKPEGDAGIDFILPLMFSIDVKTSQYPRERNPFLLVEEGKVNADIYVLALIEKEDSCECVGWMSKEQVLKYNIGDLGTGVKNHQVPMSDLNPMKRLTDRFINWKNMGGR